MVSLLKSSINFERIGHTLIYSNKWNPPGFKNVMTLINTDENGHPQFPLFPLSFLIILMNAFNLIFIAISTSLIFVCFHMWFSVNLKMI